MINPNTPFLTPDGRVTREWLMFFYALSNAIGGVNDQPDLTTLLGTMDENFSATIEIENSLNSLRAALAMDDALAARVAELRKAVDDLGQTTAGITDATPALAEVNKATNQLVMQVSLMADAGPSMAELAKRMDGLENAQAFTNTPQQEITLSGDVTGYGTYSITVTLANSGVNAGTYQGLTVDAKGRITAASSIPYARTDQSNSWASAQTLPSASKILSGSTSASYGAVGRTGNDFIYGVAGAANDFVNGTAPGDTVLNANNAGATLWFLINGAMAGKFSGSGFLASQLMTTQTPTASTTASDHSVPIVLNGTTYYMRLSSTA